MYPASGGRKCPKYSFRLNSEAAHVSWIVHAASSAGVLNGVICLHLDDMWGTGDELFESKQTELDKLVGFGSMKRQEFHRCGK